MTWFSVRSLCLASRSKLSGVFASTCSIFSSASSTATTTAAFAIGNLALENCTGNHNTAVGYRAGRDLTSGVENVLG